MDDSWVEPQKPKRTVTPEQKAQRAKNKVKRGAHVTATQLAHELKVSPRVVRAHLRALKLPKPTHGWAWPQGEAKVIKARIAKRMRHAVDDEQPELATTVDETIVIEGPALPDNIVKMVA